MPDKCENCTEKCPKAEMAHQAAMGRMYATNEFINLQKKIDSGKLVEVVRCKECFANECCSVQIDLDMGGEGYCPKGRKAAVTADA